KSIVWLVWSAGEHLSGRSAASSAYSGLDQFSYRRAVLDDEHRPALVVEVGRIQRDAEVMINRRRDVARRDGPFGNFAAIPRAGADDLTVPKSSASHAHRHHVRPVVAAVRAVLCAEL